MNLESPSALRPSNRPALSLHKRKLIGTVVDFASYDLRSSNDDAIIVHFPAGGSLRCRDTKEHPVLYQK